MKNKKIIITLFSLIFITFISCEKNNIELDHAMTTTPTTKPLKAPVVGKEVVKANDFLNSTGICAHWYANFTNADHINMVKYLGIRNVRGGWSTVNEMIQLRQQAGVRGIVQTWNDLPFEQIITRTIATSKQLVASDALLAIEGMNEPCNWPVTYEGVTSSPTNSVPIAHSQRDLYTQVKADWQLANYPVFHSSLGAASQAQNLGMQFLQIPAGAGTIMAAGTKFADYANLHPYFWNQPLIDNAVWRLMTLGSDNINDAMYSEHCHTWNGFNGYTLAQLPTIPRVITESGFTTVAESGFPMVSEDYQGKAVLNTFLDAYKQGFSYTFWYQLKEDELHHGLYRPDNSPKLGATYLHNMTTILADNSSNFTPGSVNYTVQHNSGLNKPETVHDMLLQKSNSTYELVIWSELLSGINDISIDLGANYSSVTVYDPTVGTWPVRTEQTNVRWVELHTMSDHPMIIEIKGGIVSSLPDIIVTSLSYNAATGIFSSILKNQGNVATPAGGWIGVQYKVDGNYATWGGITGSLAAGATVTIGSDGGAYNIPAGTHTISVLADDNAVITETNENNNTLTQPIVVSSLPDVIVTTLSYNTSTGIFTCVVKNQSTSPTPAGVVIGVAYSVDGVNRTWGSVAGPLAAGASVTIGSDGGAYNIPSGTHTIMAYVDDVNRFTEANENNNSFSTSITR
ncbi:MAG: CARDB domain-containing protein [Paludibacter sp.]|nr:CARDB domain-containing protein [Paludibacter sp.]